MKQDYDVLTATVVAEETKQNNLSKNEGIHLDDLSSMSQIMYGIGQYQTLTADKERALLYNFKINGNMQAREALINANLKLVMSIVKTFDCKNKSYGMDDLFQQGTKGLMYAIDKFDINRTYTKDNVLKDIKLSTYATPWIKEQIKRYIEEEGRTIRLSGNMNEDIAKLSKLRAAYAQEFGEEGTSEQIADFSNGIFTVKKIREMDIYVSRSTTVSLDKPLGDDEEDGCLGDTVGYEDEDDDGSFLSGLSYDEKKIIVSKLMCKLSPRANYVITRYFGLDGNPTQSLESISIDIGGISKERVRQIKDDAIKKLLETVKYLKLEKLGE